MGTDITITVTEIDDIIPISEKLIEVTLSGVVLKDLVSDVTPDVLLDEIDTETIREYLANRDESAAEAQGNE